MESEKRHNFLGIYQLPSRKNRTLSTSCLYASYVLFSIKRTPFRGAKLIYMFDLSRIQIPLLYQLSETAIMFVLTLYIIKPMREERAYLNWRLNISQPMKRKIHYNIDFRGCSYEWISLFPLRNSGFQIYTIFTFQVYRRVSKMKRPRKANIQGSLKVLISGYPSLKKTGSNL